MYVRERNLCQSGKLRFRVLAPSRREVPRTTVRNVISSEFHSDLMFDLQKLRGEVYREYAGIAATLLPDGRHWHRLDSQSWHIVLQAEDGDVVGCARYRIIDSFDDLICSKAAVAMSPVTGPVFRSAFAQEVAAARQRGLHYGEASAWALSERARCSTAAVNIALMSFALAEWLGGGVGLTTASTRHHASSILRRIGGSPLAGFDPYYEPMFDCSIELLRFDIRSLEPRCSVKLDQMRAELRRALILCPAETSETRPKHLAPLSYLHSSYRPLEAVHQVQ
jgi:hypothetical protein